MVIPKTPIITGPWTHIYDPCETYFIERTTKLNRNNWYTNDHCFVKDPDGTWHAYGIIGYRVLGMAFSWITEKNLFHITSDSLLGEWKEHDYALSAKREKGEQYTWAPHVIMDKDGMMYMFYAAGNLRPFSIVAGIHGRIQLAMSGNGFDWHLSDRNPVFSGPGNARDPMIFEHNGEYYAYYTSSYDEEDKQSCVSIRKSPDLIHWSGPKICFIYPGRKSKWAGNSESPFVVKYEDLFYLFVCHASRKYNLTSVYWSENLERFPSEQKVCDLETHASEIIYDEKEGWYISNTGWDKEGLFISPLEWN